MELKTARLTVLVDPAKKKAFEALCARQDVTPSQVVRRLIRDFLAQHGVSDLPADAQTSDQTPDPARSPHIRTWTAQRAARGSPRPHSP